jgi:hypothetical protein
VTVQAQVRCKQQGCTAVPAAGLAGVQLLVLCNESTSCWEEACVLLAVEVVACVAC